MLKKQMSKMKKNTMIIKKQLHIKKRGQKAKKKIKRRKIQ